MNALGTKKLTNIFRASNFRWAFIVKFFCTISILAISAVVANEVAFAQSQNMRGTFNGRIAFTSDRHNRALSIWTINPDGSDPQRLTFPTPRGAQLPASSRVSDSQAAWSPDGTKIAYVSTRDCGSDLQTDNDCARIVYVMNADGSNTVKIRVQNIQESITEIKGLRWSPDGTKIAFDAGAHITANFKGSTNIYIANADGTGIVKLTNDTNQDNQLPSWSPDGRQLVFMSDRDTDNRTKLWVVNTDGSGLRKLTDVHNSQPGYYDDLYPSWSPDGKRIVFLGARDFNGTRDCNKVNCEEIFTVSSVDGSDERQLTNDLNTSLYTFPRWSPDGTQIVFTKHLSTIQDIVNGIDRGTAIVTMNADGSNQQRITFRSDFEAFDVEADWQPLAAPYSPTPPALLSFSAATYQAYEDIGSIPITVTRTGNTTVAVSCFYATDLASAPASGVTADVRYDYSPVYGTLQFAPSETSKTILIPLNDNGNVRGNRTFKIALYDNEGNATFQGGTREATITILDRDTIPRVTNPIDSPNYFVRQQYVDFLNREPDASGSQFWTNEIVSCNGNAACIDIKRQNVSAAFYLSTEFQETGYFLLRACTLLPDVNYAGFFGFERALQQVGRGVIVGQGNWQQQLETNKQQFIQQFFDDDRADLSFGRTNAEYVDLLYQYAGVQPGAATRNALVSSLDAGTQTRAGVLRQIVDDPQFKQNSFRQAFVLMQYYGYLRREPDGSGYNFWLNKLNSFGGDYIRSEMVRSFIVSSEYRQRFGR
jgi:Tol biopolymer transport system component